MDHYIWNHSFITLVVEQSLILKSSIHSATERGWGLGTKGHQGLVWQTHEGRRGMSGPEAMGLLDCLLYSILGLASALM